MILLAVLSPTRPLAAQNWSVVGGALGGVGDGAWVGLGYLTVRARGWAYLDTPGYKARQVAVLALAGLATGIGLSVRLGLRPWGRCTDRHGISGTIRRGRGRGP